MRVPKSEIENRVEKFYKLMNERCPDWDIALIFDRVNQYYFTGTMQNSVLIFRKSGDADFFVRKSYTRAKIESEFPNIHEMSSFKDIPCIINEHKYKSGYVEINKVPIGLFKMINKYLKIENVKSIDSILGYQRSVKSKHEIEILKEIGKRHNEFVLNVVPTILKEGMTELEFAAKCSYEMIKAGHQGTSRLSVFQANTSSGELAFGENSIYPTNFDGPGGSKGLYPAQSRMGDENKILKKGDLVFVDSPFGMYGYHTDVTRIFMFKDKVSNELKAAHNECLKIEKLAGEMMKIGALPSEIYNKALESLDSKYKDSFMGANGENVKFLGHGIGLYVDEMPVISPKFNEPLEENMVIAVEPKISIEGVGLVGIEDNYIVTKDGGECITGGGCEIIEVN